MEINKNKGIFFKVFIWFLTGFLTGFLTFSLKTEFETNKIYLNEGKLTETEEKKISSELDLSDFWMIYSIIKDNYIGVDGLNKEQIVNSAIHGLVEGLGDKHSEYLYGNELQNFKEGLNGNFEGIGAFVSKTELGIKIESTIKGSPAKKYGILPGDIVIEANGVDLTELNKYEAISHIKGPSGSSVILKIYREGEGLIEKTVIRSFIKIPSVNSEKIDKIGYISINTFGDTTSKEFKSELNTMLSGGAEGLIIDLRDNGGGYLFSAVEVLSNFVESRKNLVTIKNSENGFFSEEYVSLNDGNLVELPIVVIINENSASASEITAGALQDYGLGVIIGEKSYGKGSVQTPFPINGNKALLKITTSKWFTPNMNSIEGVGITPDIVENLDIEKVKNGEDNQKDKAVSLLNEMINGSSIEEVISKNNK